MRNLTLICRLHCSYTPCRCTTRFPEREILIDILPKSVIISRTVNIMDRMIREQAERGYSSVSLEYATWRPMKNFINALGYKVTHGRVDENTHYLEVSWG